MLIGVPGQSRLAPLYDMASMLPYGFSARSLKMATRIGGKYRLEEVASRHWSRFAADVRLPPAEFLDMGVAMAEALPAAFGEIVERARADGLDHPILERMVEVLDARSARCAQVLRSAAD